MNVRFLRSSLDYSRVLSLDDENVIRVFERPKTKPGSDEELFLPFESYSWGRSEYVYSVGISPDGGMVAAGYFGSLELFRTGEAKPVKRIGGLNSAITAIAWLRDGREMVAGSSQGAISWIDTGTGKVTRSAEIKDKDILAVGQVPESDQVYSIDKEGTLRLWDSVKAKELKRIRLGLPDRGHLSAKQAPGGRLFVCRGSAIFSIDLKSLKLVNLSTPGDGDIYDLDLNPRKPGSVYVSRWGEIAELDAATGSPIRKVAKFNKGGSSRLAFLSGGADLIVSIEASIHRFDMARSAFHAATSRPLARVHSMSFEPGGSSLSVHFADGSTQRYMLSRAEPQFPDKSEAGAPSLLAASASGAAFAYASFINVGVYAHHFEGDAHRTFNFQGITSIAIAPDDRNLLAFTDSKVHIVDFYTQKTLTVADLEGYKGQPPAFDPAGTRIYLSKATSIREYAFPSMTKTGEYQGLPWAPHQMEVSGKLMAFRDAKKVGLYDLAASKLVWQINLDAFKQEKFMDLAFLPGKDSFISVSDAGYLRMYARDKQKAEIQVWDQGLDVVAIHPDGRWAACSSLDGVIHLVDLERKTVLHHVILGENYFLVWDDQGYSHADEKMGGYSEHLWLPDLLLDGFSAYANGFIGNRRFILPGLAPKPSLEPATLKELQDIVTAAQERLSRPAPKVTGIASFLADAALADDLLYSLETTVERFGLSVSRANVQLAIAALQKVQALTIEPWESQKEFEQRVALASKDARALASRGPVGDDAAAISKAGVTLTSLRTYQDAYIKNFESLAYSLESGNLSLSRGDFDRNTKKWPFTVRTSALPIEAQVWVQLPTDNAEMLKSKHSELDRQWNAGELKPFIRLRYRYTGRGHAEWIADFAEIRDASANSLARHYFNGSVKGWHAGKSNQAEITIMARIPVVVTAQSKSGGPVEDWGFIYPGQDTPSYSSLSGDLVLTIYSATGDKRTRSVTLRAGQKLRLKLD